MSDYYCKLLNFGFFVFQIVLTCVIAACSAQIDPKEAKILKEQRRMLLMEQLKSIKKELGLEKDDKAALLGRCGARVGM